MFLPDKFCSAKIQEFELEQGRGRWIVAAKATSHAPEGTQGSKESKRPHQATNSIRVSFTYGPVYLAVWLQAQKPCSGERLLCFRPRQVLLSMSGPLAASRGFSETHRLASSLMADMECSRYEQG